MQTKASFRLLGIDERPDFRSPRVAAFHEYWCSLAPTLAPGSPRGLPRRADFDPAEIAQLLPYVMIVDLEDEDSGSPRVAPFRIRYRLVGTAVVKFSGLDFTGAYLDELDFDICTTDDLSHAYGEIRSSRQPGLGLAFAEIEDEQVMDVEYLICPLRTQDAPAADAGQPVRQCIAIEDYMPSAHYDPARNVLGRKSF